jgi:hypothetical protein
MPPRFPEFRARAPWWGADLQTLRNALRERRDLLLAPGERHLLLPLDDGTGDALVGRLRPAPQPSDRPLVLLIHGLSGCEASPYMQRALRASTVGSSITRAAAPTCAARCGPSTASSSSRGCCSSVSRSAATCC